MNAPSLHAALRMCARLQPNETALTYIDYEQDWDGVAHSLTWSQLHRRVLNVAQELRSHGSAGDRAVILAPQGLEYTTAFLGALQAGLIAVPLSVPLGGVTDERVDSVMRDASPTVVLTTSAVIGDVAQHVTAQPGERAPSIIEVDSLDLDAPNRSDGGTDQYPSTAYLQYTSGSTRNPAGVMMTHENARANMEQLFPYLLADADGSPLPGLTLVSWLPLYHDMGLYVGVCGPILLGVPTVFTSPASFLQRPARWMHMLANSPQPFTAGPNFAFDMAARKISDEDMAGFDLGNVHAILSGSERVQPATIKRFADRFARFNLPGKAIRPGYGLAEATVWVAASKSGQPPEVVEFDSAKLPEGQAKKCASGGGTPLVSYHLPKSPITRIVDPDTRTECPEDRVGEIWVHGTNVAKGYWQKPELSEYTFEAKIVNPSEGTPEGPWLRTGDSGFIADGKLFILARIKDLLIVYGRNHSPDDIEATIQQITRGRCAAIAVPDRDVEKLVAIIEFKKRGDSEGDATSRLGEIKRELTAAISTSHGLTVADIVLVPPGSIPLTTSGKIRRRECVEQYRQNQFTRIDA